MKTLVFISVVCLQLGLSQVKGGHTNGVGAFSYQDSTGNRYGGTYGLKDGEVVDAKGSFPPDFSPPTGLSPPTIDYPEDFTGFYPEYFRNLENLLQDPGLIYKAQTLQQPYTPITTTYSHPSNSISSYGGWAHNEPDYAGSVYNTIADYGGLSYNSLPEYGALPLPLLRNIPNFNYHNPYLSRAFGDNLDNKKVALNAARKAFDLTSNQAGTAPDYNPPWFNPFYDFSRYDMSNGPQLPQGFPFGGGIPMPNFGNNANSAYAGAAVGPGFSHQVAAVNPGNPNSPNINKMNSRSGNSGGYTSVSSSSHSSSSDINGRKSSVRSAETVVNDNGKITRYSVHDP